NRYVSAVMIVGVEINMFYVSHHHHSIKNPMEFRGPQNRLHARQLTCLRLCQLVTFPERDLIICFSKKQDLTILLIGKIGTKHQRALLLVDTRKVKEIGVLSKAHSPVGIRRHDVVGIENDYRVGFDFLKKVFPVLDKKLLADILIAHGLKFGMHNVNELS